MEARDLPSMTVDEYLAIDAESETRWEFVDGEAFECFAARVDHNLVVANVSGALRAALVSRPCAVLGSQQRVARGDRAFFYPDVVVACGPIATRSGDELSIVNPTLIVEVLSPTTEDYDRSTKFDHCRRLPSLNEFLFVSTERREIERRRRLPSGEWVSRWFDAGDVDLESLGVSLSVAQVFEKLELAPKPRGREMKRRRRA